MRENAFLLRSKVNQQDLFCYFNRVLTTRSVVFVFRECIKPEIRFAAHIISSTLVVAVVGGVVVFVCAFVCVCTYEHFEPHKPICMH